MKKLALIFLLIQPLHVSADTILFGDHKNGSKLHQQSCTSCHDSSIYTRNNRKVGTINGLEKRVAMCDTMLKTHYSDEQKSDIVKFLNDDYYKFK